MESRLKFEIGSVFNGDGFKKAQAALDRTSKSVQKAGGVVASFGGSLGQLGGTTGTVARGVGDLINSFTMGGPWGVVIAAVTAVIGLTVKWRNSVVETRKAHAELMAKMEEGYQRRLASYADKARKAEEAALDVAIRKGQAAVERIRALASAYQQLGRAEDAAAASADRVSIAQIDAETEVGGADKVSVANAEVRKQEIRNEQALRAADRSVYEATAEYDRLAKIVKLQREGIELQRKRGLDVGKAELELATLEVSLSEAMRNRTAAENNRAAAIVEGENALSRLQRQAAQAEEEVIAAQEREAKARKDAAAREEAENRTAQAKRDGASRLDQLDRQIARAQQDVRSWEEAAVKMRGRNFRDYMADEKAAETSGDAFAKANASDARRASRIRGNARHGWANARELAWLDKYDRWHAAQDPANNPAQKSLEKLQEERAQTVVDIKNTVDGIQADLKKAITVE